MARDAERIVQETVNVDGARSRDASDDASRLSAAQRRTGPTARDDRRQGTRRRHEAAGRRAQRRGLHASVPAPAPRAPNHAALSEQLRSLDVALATVRTIPDPGVQTQVAELEVLRSYGQQALLRGLSPVDFETRKTELLALLDSIERRGEPAIRLRVASLRQRIVRCGPVRWATPSWREAAGSARNSSRAFASKWSCCDRRTITKRRRPRTPATDPALIGQTLEALRRQLAELDRGRGCPSPRTPRSASTRKESSMPPGAVLEVPRVRPERRPAGAECAPPSR